MQNHFSGVTFVGIVISVALFQKLAARMMRRTSLSWKHSAVFGIFVAMLKSANHLAGDWLGTELGYGISVIFGLFVTAVIGGWFFRLRATTTAGESLGWRGGMQLAALGFALMMLATLIIAVLRLIFPK